MKLKGARVVMMILLKSMKVIILSICVRMVKVFLISDYDYLMPNENECELEVGSSFNEVSNALFDEDIDMDQPILFLNIFERGFHLISNPLYEEIIENPRILNIDQGVIVYFMLFDENQFSSMTGYDWNVEGILYICEYGLYDKERAIQADQGILVVSTISNVQEYKSEFLITF